MSYKFSYAFPMIPLWLELLDGTEPPWAIDKTQIVLGSCTTNTGCGTTNTGYVTTNAGYGTTNADAGAGIGMKRGDSEIWQKKTIN